MLRRKIEKTLLDWKNTPNHKPLILKGCRQCGKTYSVLEFAKKNYAHTVYLNFSKSAVCFSVLRLIGSGQHYNASVCPDGAGCRL